MRLGTNGFVDSSTPEAWVGWMTARGYRAAYFPGEITDEDEVRAYARAAEAADIVIAEVGAWSNPLGPDPDAAREAREHCKRRLAIADLAGARCCVNITGSRGEPWDGHHPANLTGETFERIVECVRDIIDSVNPSRAYYTLETMPWMHPDSVESYVRLLEAVDRERFAVHFDPVNLISSPQRYYANAALIGDFVKQLGPRIRSCHAKDVRLDQRLTVHLDEVVPGRGGLDYATLLRELDSLGPDMTLITEHMASLQEFDEAAAHIRAVAGELGIAL